MGNILARRTQGGHKLFRIKLLAVCSNSVLADNNMACLSKIAFADYWFVALESYNALAVVSRTTAFDIPGIAKQQNVLVIKNKCQIRTRK